MRILIVSHYCLPHIGGIEAILFEQARALVKLGNKVIVISSKTNNECAFEIIDGVRVHRILALNIFEDFFGVPYPIFSVKLLPALRREISQSDVCLIHSFGFMSSLAASFFCYLYNIPYVLIQNNQYIQYPNYLLNVIEHLNDYFFGRFVVKHASQVLSVSYGTKEYVNKVYKKHVEILINPVNLEVFTPSKNKKLSKRTVNLPESKFIVFTCGRLVFKRSVKTLISVAEMMKNDTRFYFVIAGDGPDRKALEEYIQKNDLENCKLVGKVAHQSINKYYQAADIFVLTSRGGEGWPLAILEAWASELPVIATSIGGQKEIIKHNENGFLIDLDAPEQIAEILISAIDKPKDLANIGKIGKNLSRSFALDAHAEKLHLFLLKASNEGKLNNHIRKGIN